MSLLLCPVKAISAGSFVYPRTARRPTMSTERDDQVSMQCFFSPPAIHESVGVWFAMSHSCRWAALRNIRTVLFPWPAMSSSACSHSASVGGLLACHVPPFQIQPPAMAPRCPPEMVSHVFPNGAMNEHLPPSPVSLTSHMPALDGPP